MLYFIVTEGITAKQTPSATLRERPFLKDTSILSFRKGGYNILQREKLKKLALNLTVDRNDYMSAFRKNIDMYVAEKDITLREIAEAADISYSTLNTFVYGNSTDCKLSTAVKLARAFGISVDELIGAGTIEDETRQTIAMSRNLKDHHRHVIRVFAKHQYLLHGDVPVKSKQISVMIPECQHGHLRTTTMTEALNIDHLPQSVKSEACLGLRIPCKHYEPLFMRDETLILGAHREGLNGEMCVVSKDGNMYICKKKIFFTEGKKEINYHSVINGNLLFKYDDIDDRIGYIIGFLNPDCSWGIR